MLYRLIASGSKRIKKNDDFLYEELLGKANGDPKEFVAISQTKTVFSL
jgi:hypothetical protein